jgi:signal transduction histidine kinase
VRGSFRARSLAALAGLAVVFLVLFAVYKVLDRSGKYHLRVDRIDLWKSYGGVWDLDHGVFHDGSGDRGAKLMSAGEWSELSYSADLQLDNDAGDVGLIIRSRDEEKGVDAYNGYYAGLRAREGTLIAGRSNYGWSEIDPVPMPGGVRRGLWYHMQLVMVGCRLGVSAENLATKQQAFLVVNDEECVASGHVGLRSLATGGRWRNLKVERSTENMLGEIASRASEESRPHPLTTELEYAKHFKRRQRAVNAELGESMLPRPAAIHMGDLPLYRGEVSKEAFVRGVVTSTAPDLYVEDSTGGIIVRAAKGPHVNAGDTVEVSGEVQPLLYSAMFTGGTVRPISSGPPIPPLAVTPWQAASGAYDARFIEIEGHLTRDIYSEHGYQVLDFKEGGESFRALYPDRPGLALHNMRKNSLLRLRGVCVLGKTYTQDLIPFLIFMRSVDDVQVLQGPPWWTPWHIASICAGGILLACSMQLLYFQFQQWKAKTISSERERIAHDIHDTMAQSFAGIGYRIQGLRTSIVRNSKLTRDDIAQQLTSTSDLVSKCHTDASRTIEMLGSSSNEERGDLLALLVQTTLELSGGRIHGNTIEQGSMRSISPKTRAVLLHIGKEAITNSVTHGQPSIITFTLSNEGSLATLVIADDGRGFESTTEDVGFGTLGMRRRAREIGGSLEVMSTPDVGTSVLVTFPVSRFNFLRWLAMR